MAAVIGSRAKRFIPRTWTALASDSSFGQDGLDLTVETIKERVFGSDALAADQEESYAPTVQDYLAKLVALELIPSGIEFWGRQVRQESTSTTNESVSYGDQIAALEKVQAWLLVETRKLQPQVEGITDIVARKKGMGPRVSDEDFDLVTPDPSSLAPLDNTGYCTPLPFGAGVLCR